MDDTTYLGPELEVFEKAVNWRIYLASKIAPHLKGDVLEVGAGIGTMTKTYLNPPVSVPVSSWLALEPDPELGAGIQAMIESERLPGHCRVQAGRLMDIPEAGTFQSILYVDVLEHIEDDRGELAQAVGHLDAGGRLIVLSPAHQWLFSALDEMAGHFRRYSRADLLALAPPDTRLVESRYLDCVGMAASWANRIMLRQGTPSDGQIRLWDRGMIPVSRLLDPLFGYRLGKSVLAVWEKA